MTVKKEKRSYILHLRSTEADGTEIYDGENYPSFPIVPLKNGEDALSELTGKRNTVDALDLCTSNMVNNVDEGNVKWCYRKLQDILLSAITGRKPYCLVSVCCLSVLLVR